MYTDIVWFRNDLRIYDNPTIRSATESSDEIIPVYIFDNSMFEESRYGTKKIGTKRLNFICECVRDLRDLINDLGGNLLIKKGDTLDILSGLVDEYDVRNIHFQTKPSTDEMETEKDIDDKLDINLEKYWTHTLYHIDDIPTEYYNIDDTFTPWRKEVQYEACVRDTINEPKNVNTPNLTEKDPKTLLSEFLQNNKLNNKDISFAGGENSAKDRVNEYIWDNDNLRNYKQTRNELLGKEYSSKFSPWLAQGCLSPRYVYEEIQEYEDKRVSNDSTYWLVFELMWRDFFQFQFLKHGSDFFKISGIRDVDKEWNEGGTDLERWKNGETGVPFVDANMRQLNQTGYMSNRGRQNVASFLVDVLNIDWRLGSAYFEKKLVDYDVCSNWGNWAYIAGVGNDSRDSRYFNVIKQSKKYDSNGEFIRNWIPELSNLPADATHQPWLLSDGQQRMYDTVLGDNYPEPIINLRDKNYSDIV